MEQQLFQVVTRLHMPDLMPDRCPQLVGSQECNGCLGNQHPGRRNAIQQERRHTRSYLHRGRPASTCRLRDPFSHCATTREAPACAVTTRNKPAPNSKSVPTLNSRVPRSSSIPPSSRKNAGKAKVRVMNADPATGKIRSQKANGPGPTAESCRSSLAHRHTHTTSSESRQ